MQKIHYTKFAVTCPWGGDDFIHVVDSVVPITIAIDSGDVPRSVRVDVNRMEHGCRFGEIEMSELAAIARSLREVRAAYQDFLMRWALDEITANAALVNLLSGDALRQDGMIGENRFLRTGSWVPETPVHRRASLDD